ncbi:MAG: hypothetical protein J0G97_08645, partial [Rhizobium pusense]|nr:hypothetical protein [Agrobacterium pusense]
IASPAARVVETLEQVSVGYGRTIEPEWDRRAYLASASMLLDLIHAAPAEAETLLNKGLDLIRNFG